MSPVEEEEEWGAGKELASERATPSWPESNGVARINLTPLAAQSGRPGQWCSRHRKRPETPALARSGSGGAAFAANGVK